MTNNSPGTAMTTQVDPAKRSVPRFLSLVSPNMKRVDPSLRPFAEQALAEAGERLSPITRTEFAGTLLPPLALVSPTGMTEEDRNEWLKAAWIALDGIPLDLLKRGVVAARFADHPAKIVPAILREIDEAWSRRRTDRTEILAAIEKMKPAPEPEAPRCTPEEARAIIEAVGLNIPPEKPDTSHRGKPIAPDAEWYRTQGIEITPNSELAA